MKHTWESMDSTPLTLQGEDLGLKPKRQKDVCLIDAFVEAGYETDELETLRDCRMHLRANFVSDISTACGSRITRAAWKGKKNSNRSQNSLDQHPPSQ